MRQSIRSLTRHPPWATLVHARWSGIWILTGWGGECELKVSSLQFQRNTNVISLKMEFFRVKSSLSRAHGSEGPQGKGFKAWSMYRKSCTVIDFAFYKKWMGHLNLILAKWERKFEQANLPKFKCQRYCPGGGREMLKLRMNQRRTIWHFTV